MNSIRAQIYCPLDLRLTEIQVRKSDTSNFGGSRKILGSHFLWILMSCATANFFRVFIRRPLWCERSHTYFPLSQEINQRLLESFPFLDIIEVIGGVQRFWIHYQQQISAVSPNCSAGLCPQPDATRPCQRVQWWKTCGKMPQKEEIQRRNMGKHYESSMFFGE